MQKYSFMKSRLLKEQMIFSKADLKRLTKDMVEINRIITVLIQCQIFNYNSGNI